MNFLFRLGSHLKISPYGYVNILKYKSWNTSDSKHFRQMKLNLYKTVRVLCLSGLTRATDIKKSLILINLPSTDQCYFYSSSSAYSLSFVKLWCPKTKRDRNFLEIKLKERWLASSPESHFRYSCLRQSCLLTAAISHWFLRPCCAGRTWFFFPGRVCQVHHFISMVIEIYSGFLE